MQMLTRKTVEAAHTENGQALLLKDSLASFIYLIGNEI